MKPRLQVVRRGEATATRWKNGGGVTHELATWPPGAGIDGFDARLSMAEVAAEGPFSTFPGIDRTLGMIDGGPMVLSFGAGSPDVTLMADGPPLPFPGEAPVHARLQSGPVLDLNIMTRRGMMAHRMVALRPGDALPPGTVAAVARGAATACGVALQAGDAIIAGDTLAGTVEDGSLLAVVLDCLPKRQVRPA
ncbi:HutD/Ves family protein [Paracoccus aeridis]|uniref:HutD/Ves family protein n=1 Tax=Paracoccus aeridis TaxID=1966466 RepID=UPI0010AAE972|nr:HutD family protein [Paracoccus aeridis]